MTASSLYAPSAEDHVLSTRQATLEHRAAIGVLALPLPDDPQRRPVRKSHAIAHNVRLTRL